MASVNDQNNPLGKSSEYVDQYDASLLFPIRRDEGWKAVGVNRADIPFHGEDIGQLKGAALRQYRKKIGMIFRHFNLFHARSVEGNIAYP